MITGTGRIYAEPGQGGRPRGNVEWHVGQTWEEYQSNVLKKHPNDPNNSYLGTLNLPGAGDAGQSQGSGLVGVFLMFAVGGILFIVLFKAIFRVMRL